MADRAGIAIVQIKLRVREDLRRKVEISARTKKVSLNNEMVARLQQSFDEREDRLERVEQKLNDIQAFLIAIAECYIRAASRRDNRRNVV
jgi:hypothetical protein